MEQVEKCTENSYSVSSIVFSHNGEYLASGYFMEISVWKTLSFMEIWLLNGEKIRIFIGHSYLVRSEVSPNRKYLTSGSTSPNSI